MKIGDKLIKWILDKRWWIAIGTIIGVVVIAQGATQLKVQNDVRIYFGEGNKQLKALEALDNIYTKNDGVLFVIAPKEGDVFTQNTLSAIKELTDISWKIPYSSRVDSIANFQNTWVDGDNLFVRDLIPDPEELTGQGYEKLRKTVLSEPRLVNLLISKSGNVAAVRAKVIRPHKSANESPVIAKFARNIVQEFREKYPNIDFYLSGETIQDVVLSEATKKDMTTLIPVMYLGMFIIVLIMLKSIVMAVIVFLIIGFSVTTSLGIGGWIGLNLNPTTATAPLIILTLGMADCIHIILSIYEYVGKGMSKIDAIKNAYMANLKPVVLTSVTTAVGFLSMNSAEGIPFREFGNFVAIGTIAALLISISFLPAVIAILPLNLKRKVKKPEGIMYEKLADFIIRRRSPILWIMLAFSIIMSIGISRIQITDNFNKWEDKSFDFRIATDFIEKNLTGIDIIEYSFDTGETGGIYDPEYLAKIDQFAQWFRKQPHVVHVATINETIKRINQDLHNGDKAYYRIPDDRNMAAQYLLLLETSLPFGHDLNNIINIDKSSTRVSVYVKDSASQLLLDLDSRAKKWLAANAPAKMAMADGTGLSMMYAHLIRNNTRTMLKSSSVALLVVIAIVIFTLRIYRTGIAFILSNILPIAVGFGIWAMIFGHAGIAISVLISMTLGIVVDDSIHMFSKYMQFRNAQGGTPEEAIRYAFKTVGKACATTTFILVVGFSILSFSGFAINKEMSIITVIIIALALLYDFTLLPCILLKLDTREARKYESAQRRVAVDPKYNS
jgi:uncharacterized protein